ncbi:MAG: hypothetical protein ACYC8T_11945 [Myxococcaceae bacterium]
MPTAEVVTYDPVRRRGFMKLLEPPGGRVVFHLGYLPQPFKRELMIISKRLGPVLKYELEDTEFSRQISSVIVGCRFTLELRVRPDGRPAIAKNSVKLLARPIGKETPA